MEFSDLNTSSLYGSIKEYLNLILSVFNFFGFYAPKLTMGDVHLSNNQSSTVVTG